jgi:hypothetical protein
VAILSIIDLMTGLLHQLLISLKIISSTATFTNCLKISEYILFIETAPSRITLDQLQAKLGLDYPSQVYVFAFHNTYVFCKEKTGIGVVI